MGTIWVREFSGGLDVRRLPETSAGGTLLRGRDGHINRGGEFEQRSQFVQQYMLPNGVTRGFASAPDGIYVFGHQIEQPGMPAGVKYQQLQHPEGRALADVPYATLFQGKLLVLGEFQDGSTYLFYDGERVDDSNAPPNVTAADVPTALLTFQQKAFVAAGATLYNSVVDDPTDFGDGSGAGSATIDMSTHAEGAETLTGLARYDQFAAIFSRDVVQIWFLDPDPALSRQVQVLNNTGTTAPRSITQFGDGDVFYLDRSGIRSLRARDSSNSAATTDIGSSIDPLLRDAIDGLTEAELAAAQGIIEPRDGRFWLLIGGTIYVLSYFQTAKVSAWTTYEPGFRVDSMFVRDDVVWLRSGDRIFTFGNIDGSPLYSDEVRAECWLPYLDADQPFRAKNLTGIDTALRGEWEVRLAMDPQNLAASDLVGRLQATTFGGYRIPSHAAANHISVRFKCAAPPSPTEPAVVASCVIHFQRDPEEDSK